MRRSIAAVLFLGLLTAGCDGPEITTVNHIRPESAHDYVFSGWLGSYDHFEVEGREFGADAGELTLGGVALEIDSWSDTWIRATLPPEATSGQLEIERADGEVIAGPQLLVNQGASPIESVFAEYLTEHSEQPGLGPAWLAWATDPVPPVPGLTSTNLSRFAVAYQRALVEEGEVSVAYHYFDGIPYPRHQDFDVGGLDVSSLTEEQYEALQEYLHMQALEAWLEAAFPGMSFTFVFEGDIYAADMVVYANVPPEEIAPAAGDASWWNFDFAADQFLPRVRAVQEGVLMHEIGHILGLWHHYTEEAGHGLFMPPGETECTMNQQGNAWCSACAAALMIGEQDPEASAALLEELRTYIDDSV